MSFNVSTEFHFRTGFQTETLKPLETLPCNTEIEALAPVHLETEAVDVFNNIFNKDVFLYTISHIQGFSFRDMFVIELVCEQWAAFVENSPHWKMFFGSVGIPMVSEREGPRNYRNDFRVIAPITAVSGEKTRKILGEPSGTILGISGTILISGTIPCISRTYFNNIFKPDSYCAGKLRKDTHVFIVQYPAVYRVLETKKTPFKLGEEGRLIGTSSHRNEGVEEAKPELVRLSFLHMEHLLKCPLSDGEAAALDICRRLYTKDTPSSTSNSYGKQMQDFPDKVQIQFLRRKDLTKDVAK